MITAITVYIMCKIATPIPLLLSRFGHVIAVVSTYSAMACDIGIAVIIMKGAF